ncbi:uncharacterized protein PRCAT00001508001 [Priceomyces carsonii]|uniref:uncharacterized protein n=1 Tax=Priceomyces carsonii TaxID=28549 RepID=UPI002ED857C5|nr:unnamed protein product [Priceomyces carsonii]
MTDNNLELIPKYLEQSILPQHAKQAESLLRSMESQPGFSIDLLHVIASTNIEPSTRLAGALFFKNLIKRKWIDEDGNYLLPINDVNQVKLQILDLMMKLPSQLQIQIGESISIIAESDFPHNWGNLIDDLVSKLSLDDFVSNKGLLIVAHSIFKKWRPLFRSDELFLEIKLVLDKFAQPFLALLNRTDQLIQENLNNKASLTIYFDNLLSLVQIYYDLNCQDIPEFFEDNMMNGMELIHKYLIFESPLITDPEEDDEIDVLIKIKTSILELISLYVTRYADVFDPLIENFIMSVWKLINDYVTKQQKFDLLVVKALGFLTSVTKMLKYQPLFKNEDSLKQITEKIILPNIYFREVDEELFEDDPINFVRSDLEGSDFDSRRKSATDFLRELKEVNTELLTNIVMSYVESFLSHADWRNKNMAIYLFSSLAAKGTVTNSGVTSTNVLVDVVKFFSENIASYLVENQATHPILRADAIKYILSFRNQLTKEQLITTIPLLIQHLQDENQVVYTYSAITIEKLFSMTNFNDHQAVFLKSDIKPYVQELLNSLFLLILSKEQSPEKLAENEFLMKCVMRVLTTVEDLIEESFKFAIASQLLRILKIISRNPSNPKFSHYIFESLGLIIKYGNDDKQRISKYIDNFLPNLLDILNEDVQEFVPYTFQIMAFMLELYPNSQPLPLSYQQLIKPLLSPAIWEFRGNVPAVTRLLIAILEQEPAVFVNSEQGLTPLLGVFQKLIASKAHDSHGFDLLQSILMAIPLVSLQTYLNQIALLLLTRLKNSRTEKYVKRFVVFICFICCLPLNLTITPELNADFAINFIDSVQQGVFPQIFNSFILPTTSSLANLQDKKISVLGLSELLLSQHFTQGSYTSLMVPTLEQLCINIATLGGLGKSELVTGNNFNGSDVDFESAAFGSSYSKIISIQVKPFDPLPNIKNNDQDAIKLGVVSNIKKLNNMEALSHISSESQQVLKTIGL